MRSRGFVIPDVRAVAVTAAHVVVDAFESVKLAVGGAETRGGYQRRKVRRGRFLHGGGKSGFAKRIRKPARAILQRASVSGRVLRRRPGIRAAGRVPGS